MSNSTSMYLLGCCLLSTHTTKSGTHCVLSVVRVQKERTYLSYFFIIKTSKVSVSLKGALSDFYEAFGLAIKVCREYWAAAQVVEQQHSVRAGCFQILTLFQIRIAVHPFSLDVGLILITCVRTMHTLPSSILFLIIITIVKVINGSSLTVY